MIKSNKLSLRPIELDDDGLLQKLMNDPFVTESVVGWSLPVSLFSQKNWIQANSSGTNYRLIIVDNETNEAIGITGLWEIDWHNQSAMSAIKILPTRTKKGFGTEAIMLGMTWAFYNLGLRRLHATILDFNGASMGVYVKNCGWRVEGCQKEAVFKKGRWHDLYSFAILKREFDALDDAEHFIDIVCPVDTTPNININLKDYL